MGGGGAEGMLQSNYRLWGDDFIEVTPDPRVRVFLCLPSHQEQASPITVGRSGLYFYVVIKKLTTVICKSNKAFLKPYEV